MENQIIIWEDAKQVAEIRKIICSTPLTDIEFATFTGIAKSTNLNPFLREIWAVKYGNSAASIFVGRDGYRKSAQAHRDYDYHQVDAIYTNDEFSVENGEVHHKYSLKDRGLLVGAYAICQRKGSTRANYVNIPLKEYNSGKSLWQTKPETMIKKVAEAQVLRMTFQELFAGTYDESEDWNKKEEEPAQPAHSPKVKEVTVTDTETGEVITQEKITNKTRADIVSSFKKLAKLARWTPEESSANMTAYLNRECKNAEGKPVSNLLFISEEQAQKMLVYIAEKIKKLSDDTETKTEDTIAEAESVTAEVETVSVEPEVEIIDIPFEEKKEEVKYNSLSEVMADELQVKKDFSAGLIPEAEKIRKLEVLKAIRTQFINNPPSND